jgi:glycerate-2-kinase
MDVIGLQAGGQHIVAVQDPSPSHQTCASATNFVQSVRSVSEGDAFCVLTGGGRMSLLKVETLTAPANGAFPVGGTALTLNVTTWEK